METNPAAPRSSATVSPKVEQVGAGPWRGEWQHGIHFYSKGGEKGETMEWQSYVRSLSGTTCWGIRIYVI